MALPTRWRLIDRPLKTQFLIAAGWGVVWFAASSAIQGVLLDRQASASRALLQAHSAVSGLILLQRDFYRQQSAVFGYLETGEKRFLSYIESGRTLWRDRIGELAPNVGDAGGQDRLKQLDSAYRGWEKLTDRFISERRTPDAEREAALARDVFGTIEVLVEEEKQEADRWSRVEGSARQASFVAIVASSLMLLAVLAYLLVRLYRSIVRPVASLSASMARFQSGELETRVEVTSRSEIGFLQASFNDTAERLEQMVRELRELDEMKSEFISTVSHELKTPLTSIGGFSRLLVQGDAGPVTDTQKEFLGIVETNVKRLSALISDLLDMERMQSGRIPLARERVDLRGVLEECRGTVQLGTAEKELSLSITGADKEIPVRGDRARLVQVFMNLFSNAVKYTERGSVSVSVELQSYAVVLKVKDTGMGIPEDEQQHLFERFYRASAARRSGEGGTGLGLVIVKSLVEAHGGRISVSSRPGEGSVFTVILPLDSGGEEASASAEVARVTKLASTLKEIWLIEEGLPVERLRAVLERESSGWDFRPVLRVFRNARELPTRGSDPALIVRGAGAPDPLSLIAPVLFVRGEGGAAFADAIEPEEFGTAVRRIVGRSARRILIADASGEVRDQLRRSLEVRGFRVDEAGAGSALLKRIGRERYDLVLVDPDFTDMDASSLLKSIRMDARGKDVPIFVLMNQNRSISSRQALLRLGADQFVGKIQGLGGVADAVTDFLEEARE